MTNCKTQERWVDVSRSRRGRSRTRREEGRRRWVIHQSTRRWMLNAQYPLHQHLDHLHTPNDVRCMLTLSPSPFAANCCDERIYRSVCLLVFLGKLKADFTKFPAHVDWPWIVASTWRCCDTLCTSGVVDVIAVFAHRLWRVRCIPERWKDDVTAKTSLYRFTPNFTQQ